MSTSRKLKTVAALGILSSAVWASTFASFSDQATAASSFSSGSIDIVVGGDASDAYAFTTLSVTNLKPGDSHYAALPVSNAGTLDFTYGMTTAASGALASALTLGIRTVSSTCDATTYAASGTSLVASATALGSSVTFASRSLAASAAEVLCFRVELPSTTLDTSQNQTATATFTFTANQLAGGVV